MTKITDLAAAATPLDPTDLVEVVQDVGGTPVNKKVPVSELGGGGGGGGGTTLPLDVSPSIPNAMDDEFDGGPTMDAKWTAFGGAAITSSDVDSTIPGHLYVSANTSAQVSGWCQAIPTFPSRYQLKITDSTFRANYSRGGGLVLLPAGAITTASPLIYHGLIFDATWKVNALRMSALATYAAQIANVTPGKPGEAWIEVEMHSATSATFRYSLGGGLLTYLSGPYTVPFTVGQIGIGVSGEGVAHEVAFDWFRRVA